MAAKKKRSNTSNNSRPFKQAKLNFGRNTSMAPKEQAAASKNEGKAEDPHDKPETSEMSKEIKPEQDAATRDESAHVEESGDSAQGPAKSEGVKAEQITASTDGNSSDDGNKEKSGKVQDPKQKLTTGSTDETMESKGSHDGSDSAKGEEAEPQHTDITAEPSNRLRIIDKVGDLFTAPDNAVLIHACNCVGSWGAGIAAAFKQKYPVAYRIHNAHCKSKKPENLVNTAQLISPSEKQGRKHWVGCLFTSVRFGKRRDSPEQILKATKPAMEALMAQIKEQIEKGREIGEVRMCQINSGLFAVPWEKSKESIETIEVDGDKVPKEVTAYVRE